MLRTAKPVQHHLTIPEGLTAQQVAALLDRAPLLDGGPVQPAEGSILPETYAYERGTTRAALIERAARRWSAPLDQAWAARAPHLPLDQPARPADPGQHRRARDRQARGAAARRRRVPQPAAPGHEAAIGPDRGLWRERRPRRAGPSRLTRAELDRDDPYNTYRIPGLPPGPISMPGAASLHAVTQPAPTDELFFVADGTGGHVFARTEAEHLRNVARWREVERTRRQP